MVCSPPVEFVDLTLTRSAANVGFADAAVDLPELGARGRILWVSVREDATAAKGSAGVLYVYSGVAGAALSSAPVAPARAAFTLSSLSGSNSESSYDASAGDRPYAIEPDLTSNARQVMRAGLRVSAVAGSGTATTIYVRIWFTKS